MSTRLRQRHVENARDRVLPGQDALEDRRASAPVGTAGMPLGLPALSSGEMALVEAWVKAGHPGPKKRQDGISAYYGDH